MAALGIALLVVVTSVASFHALSAQGRSGACRELVLHNGTIATMDSRNTMARSVTIRGDRIAAVGTGRGVPTHDACATVVVLSDDVFDARQVPDAAIKRVHSVLTIVGGVVVYDALTSTGTGPI